VCHFPRANKYFGQRGFARRLGHRQERAAVASTLAETQRAAAELSRQVGAAAQKATLTRDQWAQIQRELAEKQAEADRQRRELTAREKQLLDSQRQLGEIQKQNQVLTMAVVAAETDVKNLRETTSSLKSQVDLERTERIKVQEAASQLAQGVGQLAEKSDELTREIRDHRPISANVLFNDYVTNRVLASFTATRKGFLGQNRSARESNTVLVTDGRQVYALLHIADTPFALGEYGVDWESLTIELSKGGAARNAAGRLDFLQHDPRIVTLPIDASQAAAPGAKVYPLAADPFKFPEAVLIDGGGRGYGEVGFKLDPSDPGFVQFDNRLFKRLFGDFSPKRGDLVFSKSGELLGIMANNDYCALLKNFTPAKTIQAGTGIRNQTTGALFDGLIARVRAMPAKLQ
jgi:X-X-X-Leu-X-X-Gly heptad repeat protein